MKTIPAILFAISLATTSLSAPQDVAKALFPKTVLINVSDSAGRPLSIGSGFVLKKGYIISNFHVIEGAGSGFMRRVGDKTKYKITGLVAKDESRDLVVLAVEGLEEDGVILSKRQSTEVGETVFAIGNPRGLEGTFSQGIVSGVREIDDYSLLQVTAPISPGSSGGPITDEKGEVIGVAVATFKGGQNLNFAIPSKYVTELQSKMGATVPLSASTKPTKGKSLFNNLQAGKSTDGITASSFLWEGHSPDLTSGSNGRFTITLKNNLDSGIRDPIMLLLFHDPRGEVVDFQLLTYNGLIPAHVGVRIDGKVDPSIKRLTTAISKDNPYMYSDRPSGNIEFRTLFFTLEAD